MPTAQSFNIDWLTHNSQRRYPLAAQASAEDVTGSFKLPNDFLVEVRLAVPAFLATPASYTIKKIQAYSTGFSVTIGYWDGTQVQPVAAGSIPRATHTLYKAYPLRGLGDFYDVSGHMTIGRLENIDLQPPGEWEFNIEGGRLELDVLSPQIRGVTGVIVVDGSNISVPLTGDLVFRAGSNMSISVTQIEGEDPVITLSAIDGSDLNEECVCDGAPAEAPAIRYINNIPAGVDGNFTLSGTSCASFQGITNGFNYALPTTHAANH
jgi:hypothetical protein